MNIVINLLKIAGGWLWARAQERSTWYGVTTAFTAAGANLNPEIASQIVNTGAAVFSTIAILTKDK